MGDYRAERARGKYGEYHLAFAAHYLRDLSMPLHNTEYNAFNRKNHAAMDGIADAGAQDVNTAFMRLTGTATLTGKPPT